MTTQITLIKMAKSCQTLIKMNINIQRIIIPLAATTKLKTAMK